MLPRPHITQFAECFQTEDHRFNHAGCRQLKKADRIKLQEEQLHREYENRQRRLSLERGHKIKKKKRKKKDRPTSFKKTLKKLGFGSYDDYLRSEKWAGIRRRVLGNSGSCVKCGGPATQVHHSSYDFATIIGESLEHLHAVCARCHAAAEFVGHRKTKLREANAFLGIETRLGY